MALSHIVELASGRAPLHINAAINASCVTGAFSQFNAPASGDSGLDDLDFLESIQDQISNAAAKAQRSAAAKGAEETPVAPATDAAVGAGDTQRPATPIRAESAACETEILNSGDDVPMNDAEIAHDAQQAAALMQGIIVDEVASDDELENISEEKKFGRIVGMCFKDVFLRGKYYFKRKRRFVEAPLASAACGDDALWNSVQPYTEWQRVSAAIEAAKPKEIDADGYELAVPEIEFTNTTREFFSDHDRMLQECAVASPVLAHLLRVLRDAASWEVLANAYDCGNDETQMYRVRYLRNRCSARKRRRCYSSVVEIPVAAEELLKPAWFMINLPLALRFFVTSRALDTLKLCEKQAKGDKGNWKRYPQNVHTLQRLLANEKPSAEDEAWDQYVRCKVILLNVAGK